LSKHRVKEGGEIKGRAKDGSIDSSEEGMGNRRKSQGGMDG